MHAPSLDEDNRLKKEKKRKEKRHESETMRVFYQLNKTNLTSYYRYQSSRD